MPRVTCPCGTGTDVTAAPAGTAVDSNATAAAEAARRPGVQPALDAGPGTPVTGARTARDRRTGELNVYRLAFVPVSNQLVRGTLTYPFARPRYAHTRQA